MMNYSFLTNYVVYLIYLMLPIHQGNTSLPLDGTIELLDWEINKLRLI